MTMEQWQKQFDSLNQQLVTIQNEIHDLEKEQRRKDQQECLKWVGRAFKTEKLAVLVTSVPPIQSGMGMAHDSFNKYQFPCIKINLESYEPPAFDETVFIRDTPFLGEMNVGDRETNVKVIHEEIAFKEFQEILEQRIQDILKLAATAKMRQQGKEVYSYRDGEICEK